MTMNKIVDLQMKDQIEERSLQLFKELKRLRSIISGQLGQIVHFFVEKSFSFQYCPPIYQVPEGVYILDSLVVRSQPITGRA